MSVSMQLGAVTEKLTSCRIKPSGSCQYPCSSVRSRRNSHAVESHHRAHVSIHQLGAVTEKLTSCRIRPSGSCQYPCSSERSRTNSHTVESSHRAHVSIHAARSGLGETHELSNQHNSAHVSHHAYHSGYGETHWLSNQAIGLMSVSMQLRVVSEKLTRCTTIPLLTVKLKKMAVILTSC